MSFALCLALTGSIERNLIVHKYLAVAPALPFSKSVCKSQNRKCVCKSQNSIQNVYVSRKILITYVGHKIVIHIIDICC